MSLSNISKVEIKYGLIHYNDCIVLVALNLLINTTGDNATLSHDDDVEEVNRLVYVRNMNMKLLYLLHVYM